MDSMSKSIWTIVILSTLGIGVIPFLIYQYGIKRNNYCPECHAKLEISDKPFEVLKKEKEGKTKTPKQKVLAKVEEKVEAETKPSRKKTTKVQKEVEIEKIEKVEKKPARKKQTKIKEVAEGKVKKEAKPRKKRICPYCGEVLKKDYPACPYCNTKLHE